MLDFITRMAWLIVLPVGTVASLITFPGGMPVMIGLWCLLFTWLMRTPPLAWFPVLQLAVILAIKQPPVGFGTVTLSVALVVCLALVLSVNRPRKKSEASIAVKSHRRRMLAAAICFWVGAVAVAWQWERTEHTARHPALDPERPIAVIGDSLSSGTAAKYAYAARLEKLIRVPVVDFSRAGIESKDALKNFGKLLAANPQCVVIEIGGHDFLHHKSRSETEANIRAMIDQARAADCEVILMEVPRDFVRDPYFSLERQLADEYDLELIADTPIRRLVLWSPTIPPGMWLSADSQLSEDGLHPNERGAQLLAEYVAAALARVYGEEILSSGDR